MDAARWLDDYLVRIRTIRWLQPDAEMDAFGDAARQWVAERVEEHSVALSRVNPRDPVSVPWSATRLVDEARARSGHIAYEGEAAVRYELPAHAWLALLDDARSAALERAKEALGPARRAEVAEAVWSVLRGPAERARRERFAAAERFMARPDGPESFVVGAPGGEALVNHALWALSAEDGAPSPWEPLVALWERGACTLAGLDGSLIAYVPLRRGDELEHTPGAQRVPFTGGVTPPSPWGVGEGGRLDKAARATLKRFNAHGLGPLPGLYPPVNVSTAVMVTNWPGPPDPYVFPPPPPVDEAAMEAAEAVHIRALVGPSPGAAPPPRLPGTPPPWYERFRKWFRK